jgi:hypothetical protein
MIASSQVPMSIPWRDRIATLLVATSLVIYLLWLAGPLAGLSAGSVALLVLALGIIASASAVVPGFAGLISGSKLYLALTSLGGVVALAGGVLTFANATSDTLAVLVIATIGLWAAATVRHMTVQRPTAAMG